MTEPMHLITEDELIQYALYYAENHSADFDGIGKVHKMAKEFEEKIRARGPMAQQAPAQKLKGSSDGWCLPQCSFFGDCDGADVRSCKRDARKQARDAALIAQEREKWERELRVKCPYKFCIELSCIFYKPNISAGNKCSKGCIVYHQSEWDLSVAAQAREDVLKELYLLAEDMISDGQRIIREEPEAKLYGKGKFTTASVFQMRIESLRSEVGK